MSTFLFLVFLAAVVAFVVNRKTSKSIKLVGNVKKVEAAVVKAVEVTTNTLDVNKDGKVDHKDVVAVLDVVKKVRKPRAKKITPKKGK